MFSMLILVVHAWRKRWDPRWLGPLVAAAMAGSIVGYGWRVMTAGVIGANLGAGFVFLFGGPLVLALLGWASVRAAALAGSRAVLLT